MGVGGGGRGWTRGEGEDEVIFACFAFLKEFDCEEVGRKSPRFSGKVAYIMGSIAQGDVRGFSRGCNEIKGGVIEGE